MVSLDSATTTILLRKQENGRYSFGRHPTCHCNARLCGLGGEMPYSASRKLQLSGFFSQSTAGDSIHHRLSFLTRDSLAALNDSPLRSLTPSLTHWSISRNKSYLDTGVHPERCLLIPNTEADPVLLSNWVRGFSHDPYLGFSKECWQRNPHMEVLLGIRENASGS